MLPNPIESGFATVRLRHRRTKGNGTRKACLAMVFKLAEFATKRWRKLNQYELIEDVFSEQTYYRWRTKYGRMDPQMTKHLKELEKENTQLKKLVADQALDMLILRGAARPNL